MSVTEYTCMDGLPSTERPDFFEIDIVCNLMDVAATTRFH